MKALSSHVFATLALVLSVSTAVADSHATFAGRGQVVGPRELARSHNVMWSVLPWFTPVAEIAPSVIVREAPTAKRLVREEPVRTAPLRSPVEEVEEHVRGGLALVSYLVSR